MLLFSGWVYSRISGITFFIFIALFLFIFYWIITLPAEWLWSIVMCMSVCVSVCSWIYLRNATCDLYPNFLCVLPMAMARFLSGRVTKSQGAIFGVFYPADNELYSMSFGTHTKTTELIKMPFEMMSGLGLWTVFYVGVTIPNGKGQFWGKHVPDKANTPSNCELNWFMQWRAHDRGWQHYCKRWTSLLLAA